MSQHPAYTAEESRARQTFLTLMWALSHPGRPHALPDGDAMRHIAATLLDLETSFYTPDATLAADLARTGARSLPADAAAYHFYPDPTSAAALAGMAAASVGTMRYPDRAATLFVACKLIDGEGLTLRGPGIPGSRTLAVAGLDESFWALRNQALRYPLGWDLLLIDAPHVVGLPRTTTINRE